MIAIDIVRRDRCRSRLICPHKFVGTERIGKLDPPVRVAFPNDETFPHCSPVARSKALAFTRAYQFVSASLRELHLEALEPKPLRFAKGQWATHQTPESSPRPNL